MAGTALKTRWRCLTPGCPEGDEGPAKAMDKASEKHGKTAGHSTTCWTEPQLPIEIPRR